MTPEAPSSVTESDLHAYVDGQLAPERAAAVEAWLAANPEARAEVEGWRRQNVAIRNLFPAADADRHVVPELKRRRSRNAAGRLIRVAASLALFVGGIGAGVVLERGRTGLDSSGPELIAEAGRINHLVYASDIRHPVEVAADQEAHLVTWLGNRLGGALRAPDLSAEGFRLIGGRLVTFASGPGALLMYEDDGGARLTLFVGRSGENRETGFQFSHDDRLNTFHWIDGPFGYALSGAMPRERLSAAAHTVHSQLRAGQG